MELTKIERNYLDRANKFEAMTRRGLVKYSEAYDRLHGYNEALTVNELNTDKTDCIWEHMTNILCGSPDQKKASLIILKMFTEWSK